MNKAKSFLVFILLFSILLGLSIPKTGAVTGHYIKVVTPGWTETRIAPRYYTTVTMPAKNVWEWFPGYAQQILIYHPAYTLQVWHPAYTFYVWHNPYTSKVRTP